MEVERDAELRVEREHLALRDEDLVRQVPRRADRLDVDLLHDVRVRAAAVRERHARTPSRPARRRRGRPSSSSPSPPRGRPRPPRSASALSSRTSRASRGRRSKASTSCSGSRGGPSRSSRPSSRTPNAAERLGELRRDRREVGVEPVARGHVDRVRERDLDLLADLRHGDALRGGVPAEALLRRGGLEVGARDGEDDRAVVRRVAARDLEPRGLELRAGLLGDLRRLAPARGWRTNGFSLGSAAATAAATSPSATNDASFLRMACPLPGRLGRALRKPAS